MRNCPSVLNLCLKRAGGGNRREKEVNFPFETAAGELQHCSNLLFCCIQPAAPVYFSTSPLLILHYLAAFKSTPTFNIWPWRMIIRIFRSWHQKEWFCKFEFPLLQFCCYEFKSLESPAQPISANDKPILDGR